MNAVARRVLSTFDEVGREALDLHTLFEFAGGNPPAAREAVLDAVAKLVEQGFLHEEESSDFYRRTEDGCLAVAGPRQVTLYTREGCHLCEDAKTQMLPLLPEFGATFREVDIDEDPILHDRYTNDLPVVFLGSRMVAQHRVNLADLRRELAKAGR